MKFYILDERNVWHQAAIEAAARAGFEGHRIARGDQAAEPGYGFIRPHADPRVLKRNQDDYIAMRERVTVIQDALQVALYEDKYSQSEFWGSWMPTTWLVKSREEANSVAAQMVFPVVSKAKEGASSVNVRILRTPMELQKHIELVFGKGIKVNCCSGGAEVTQRGYLILQQFVPHQVTWRVNAIGSLRAVFRRFNYPDKPVAQTGNVEPVMAMTEQIESLLDFSNQFFAQAKTNWCAIDVLEDPVCGWRLLETSLAWPWPSPGDCNNAPLFGSSRRWAQMFDAMFDEIKAGTWQTAATSA